MEPYRRGRGVLPVALVVAGALLSAFPAAGPAAAEVPRLPASLARLAAGPAEPSTAATPVAPVYWSYGPALQRLPCDEVLSATYGDGWRRSAAWQLYERLSCGRLDPVLRELLGAEGVPLRVVAVYDAPELVVAGEDLFLPAGDTRRVEAGQALSDVAAKAGCSSGDLVAANPYRFLVQSQCLRATGDRSSAAALILVGDSRFERLTGGDEQLDGLIVHEVAHSQDKRPLPLDAYGADGLHGLREIGPPARALVEGWACYHEARVSSRMRASLAQAPYGPFSRRDRASGRVVPVVAPSFEERTASEGVVASFLRDLDDGDAGRRARIFEAFRSANRVTGVTLRALVGSYVYRSPDELVRVALVLDAATGFTASDDQLRALLSVPRGDEGRVDGYLGAREGYQRAYARFAEGARVDAADLPAVLRLVSLDQETGFELEAAPFEARAVKLGVAPSTARRYFARHRDAVRRLANEQPIELQPPGPSVYGALFLGASPAAFVRAELAPRGAALPPRESSPGFDGLEH